MVMIIALQQLEPGITLMFMVVGGGTEIISFLKRYKQVSTALEVIKTENLKLPLRFLQNSIWRIIG